MKRDQIYLVEIILGDIIASVGFRRLEHLQCILGLYCHLKDLESSL